MEKYTTQEIMAALIEGIGLPRTLQLFCDADRTPAVTSQRIKRLLAAYRASLGETPTT